MSELVHLSYEVAAKSAVWDKLPIIMAKLLTGEIVHVTTSAASIFGYTTDELMGKVLEILVPNTLREAHVHWRQDVKVPALRLMGEGRRVTGLRKDGSAVVLHVGLTEFEALGDSIGLAFIIDLSGALAVLQGLGVS